MALRGTPTQSHISPSILQYAKTKLLCSFPAHPTSATPENLSPLPQPPDPDQRKRKGGAPPAALSGKPNNLSGGFCLPKENLN